MVSTFDGLALCPGCRHPVSYLQIIRHATFMRTVAQAQFGRLAHQFGGLAATDDAIRGRIRWRCFRARFEFWAVDIDAAERRDRTRETQCFVPRPPALEPRIRELRGVWHAAERSAASPGSELDDAIEMLAPGDSICTPREIHACLVRAVALAERAAGGPGASMSKSFSMRCAQPGCTGVVPFPIDNPAHEVRCISCFTRYCGTCSALAHAGACDPGAVESAAAVRRDARPCPRCSVPIVRDGGCSHMLCLECGYHFDWVRMTAANAPVDPNQAALLRRVEQSRRRGQALAPHSLDRDLPALSSIGDIGWLRSVAQQLGDNNFVTPTYSSKLNELMPHGHLALLFPMSYTPWCSPAALLGRFEHIHDAVLDLFIQRTSGEIDEPTLRRLALQELMHIGYIMAAIETIHTAWQRGWITNYTPAPAQSA